MIVVETGIVYLIVIEMHSSDDCCCGAEAPVRAEATRLRERRPCSAENGQKERRKKRKATDCTVAWQKTK